MTSPTTLTVEGVVRELVTTRRPAPIALFFSAVAETLSVLPTAPNTDKGRARARFIKGALLGTGLLIVLAGYETGLLIALGVCMMLLAPVVPVGQAWKRDTVRALRKRQFTAHTIAHPATLVHDGRRLILEQSGERLRRVLTNRKFSLDVRAARGARSSVWIGVSPRGSRKKREAIWMLITHHTEPDVGELFESEQADTPVVLDAKNEEVMVLLARLKDASKTAS